MDIAVTLKKLSRAHGLTGREESAAAICRELLLPYMDEVSIDPFGCVIGVKRCGKANAPVLMFDAHIDQVGFYVTGYAERGLWRIDEIGMDTRLAPGMAVRVRLRDGREIPAMITCGEGEDRGKSLSMSKMYLDAGLDEAESLALIHPGDPIVTDYEIYDMPGGFLYGPAADDRCCFAALVRMTEKLKDAHLEADIVIQGATREEVGGPSAEASAARVKPDVFFAVDVCHAKSADNPGGEDFRKGPAISRQGTCDPRVSKKLFEIAEKYHLPHQTYLIGFISGTNAGNAQIAGTGIPCGIVSLPIRYMHAPYEVVCIEDLETLSELCYRYACEFRGLEEAAQ